MEDINIHNYEAFLLDYSEGVLTDEQICDLELFIMINPNLGIDLSELDLVEISDDVICFQEKAHLKKTDSDLISENQFIGYIEKQLSESDMIHVEKSCALNNSLAKELNLYKSTCIVADETIIYPTPNILKRKPKVIWYNFSASKFAAAATIVLLLGVFFVWSKFNADIKHNDIVALTEDAKIDIKKDIKTNSENNLPVNHKQIITKVNLKNVALNGINKKAFNKVVAQTSENKLKKDTNAIQLVNSLQNFDLISNGKKIDLVMPIVEKSNSSAIISVITETETQEGFDNQRKKGVWAIVCRTLNKLNKMGIKAVNGNENDNTGYALNLGELSVKHNAGRIN